MTVSHPQPVALVTGAGRNIGRSIALALARDGFLVAVNVRSSLDEGLAVVAELRALGVQAEMFAADVTDRAAVQDMIKGIQFRFGRLDVLVNNAAIRREATLEFLSEADWRHTLSVVLDGAFFCSQAAAPLLRQSPRGAIINIGGLTGHTGALNRVHVVTAKAGLVGFTRALAHDLASDQVTVNCVSPGMISTVRNSSSAPNTPQHHSIHHPLLGRRGTPEEVADMVSWLSGPQARFITGQVLHLNGGTHLGS